jgi:ABC-type amino acid transport substrate-binding protein
MTRRTLWLLFFASFALSLPVSSAIADTLTVVTRHVPPFAIKQAEGSWRGVSIDLWRHIAEQLGVDTEFREMGLQKMLDTVAAGKADAAVAALTITSEREAGMDFTHPFLTSGLGIAVHRDGRGGWLAVSQRLYSGQFLKAISGLLALLLAVGVLVWFLERRRNTQFGGRAIEGIGSGLWWSAVTMTTVGYGDKAPQTLGGRAVAMVWMFASVIIISSITAAIATALTVGELGGKVNGEEDLGRVRVATVANSTSAQYLQGRKSRFRGVDDIDQALQLLAEGEVDAVVYDAPILRYRVKQQFDDRLAVLPGSFERQDYGFALPSGSALREPINRTLLERLHDPVWEAALFDYLGHR